MFLLVFLMVATIMAVFAIMGFMRVARGPFITLLILLGGLLFLRYFGAQMISNFNRTWGLLKGGSSANLINPQNPAGFYFLMFCLILLMAVGLGSLKPFMLQGRFSVGGFVLGLANGYIVATYTLAALVPAYAFLPVPIQIQGMTPATPATIQQASTSQLSSNELLGILNNLASNPGGSVIVAGAIVLFIVLATRMSGGKGGKKG